MAFIEDRENYPEFYSVPEEWYKESERTIRQHYSSAIKIDGEDLHGIISFFSKNIWMFMKWKRSMDITGNAFSKDFVTDENGQIHVEDLRVSDYEISEVPNKANEKYEFPANVTVTVHEVADDS